MKSETVNRRVQAWLNSSELTMLVRSFGGPNADGRSTLDYVRALAEFSSVWDYRKGKERTGIEQQDFTTAQIEAIENAARALGMIGYKKPSRSAYDHLVILGGTLLSCYLRVNFARKLLSDGLSVGKVYALGTRRAPNESEWPALEAVTKADFSKAADEFEMLCAAMVECGMVAGPHVDNFGPDHPRASSFERRFESDLIAQPVSVLCTEGSAAPTRATTVDTYEHWIGLAKPTSESSLLLITSQIYAPFQEFDAIRLISLKCDAYVEMVGMPPPDGIGKDHLLHKPENYLQEIRSAILAAERLALAAEQ